MLIAEDDDSEENYDNISFNSKVTERSDGCKSITAADHNALMNESRAFTGTEDRGKRLK